MIKWFIQPSMVHWRMPQMPSSDAIQIAYHAIEELQRVVSAQDDTIKALQARIEELEAEK